MKNYVSDFIKNIIERFYAVEENKSVTLPKLRNVLIVRQHNQFGDMLTMVPLLRAIKEKYPKVKITLIAGTANHYAVSKCNYIDSIVVFKQNKIFNPYFMMKFVGVLRDKYDLCIVPSVVSMSFTSGFLARLSNSKTRIGPASLNGEKNPYAFLFDRRIALDWRKYPDAHVSDFSMDIVKPFNIKTRSFKSEINFDKEDVHEAKEIIREMDLLEGQLLIGLHIGAGKPPNRWSLMKFINLVQRLNQNYKALFYFTGSSSDKPEIDYIKENLNISATFIINKKIPVIAALISKSDLFITNDTGIMHVAGSTDTPQISIFGPTNPFNWAPVGPQKYFIRKSELIDDISVDDVYRLADMLLAKKNENR